MQYSWLLAFNLGLGFYLETLVSIDFEMNSKKDVILKETFGANILTIKTTGELFLE